MPWTGESFRRRHNKGLSPAEAGKAAKQANAILRSGGDEGIAIATANKHANETRRETNTAEATAGVQKAGKHPQTPSESRKKRYDNPRHIIKNKKGLEVSNPLTGAVLA